LRVYDYFNSRQLDASIAPGRWLGAPPKNVTRLIIIQSIIDCSAQRSSIFNLFGSACKTEEEEDDEDFIFHKKTKTL